MTSSNKNKVTTIVVFLLLLIACASGIILKMRISSQSYTPTDSVYCESHADLENHSKKENGVNRLPSSSAHGKTAIGNIRFGISKSEFDNCRTKFLVDYPSLADFNVANVQGIFDKDHLIAVIVNSKQHSSITNNTSGYSGVSIDPYEHSKLIELYRQKYGRDKLKTGYFLNQGISYEILFNEISSPNALYNHLINGVTVDSDIKHEGGIIDAELQRSRCVNEEISYKVYDYIIISNKLYIDSLKTMRGDKTKNSRDKNIQKTYQAI